MFSLRSFRSRRFRNPQIQDHQLEKPSFFNRKPKSQTKASGGAFFQTKLTIGQPGDKYEQEADKVADAVVNHQSHTPAIQAQEISSVQRATLATPMEDEKLGTAEDRMEEDKMVQEKPEIQQMEEEEEPVQMMGEEEEEPVQMMGEEEEEPVQMMGDEEEELAQTKVASSPRQASPNLSSKIKSSTGNGRTMPAQTQAEMEHSIGADFSEVNIHTDRSAVEMNRSLGAQAFTHGKDVYFNSGKYNPDTAQGKHLLAHELTHVVQQNEEVQAQVQRKPFGSNRNWFKRG